MTKALALLSGGLDSILAIKVIQDQGIEVEAICYTSPFFSSEKGKRAANMLGVSFRVIDISHEVLELVRTPKHGHGRFMNPCIDCHALMVKKAREMLEEGEASFIITGEVLGERPKSQNRNALGLVEIESGSKGYLLRPLSAKLLGPTVVENEGLVDRERLLEIKGRSRKPQLALAKEYGIKDFPAPAGGCLLTEEKFSLRLRDLLAEKTNPTLSDLTLLRWGRHFRSSEGIKIVVSRQHNENEKLEKLSLPTDSIFEVDDYPGPKVLARGNNVEEVTLVEAAMLTARYSKARDLAEVRVSYHSGDGKKTGSMVARRPLRFLESGKAKISLIDAGKFKK